MTKIDYNKVVSISPNSIENDLLYSWLSLNTYPTNHELVELHLDYEDDERFNTYYIGKIIKEGKNQLLFASLNNLGQLDGILLISTKHITHIVHQSHELDYYCYLMNHHLQNNTFNPRNLNTDYTFSSKHFIKINNLIGIDNAKFDNTNIGIVKEIHDNCFLLQNIDEYRISDNIQKIYFDDLIAVELTSNEQVLLKDYLNIE